MKLENVETKQIKTNHLDNGHFHCLSLITNPKNLPYPPIFVSENMELYGVSLSVYNSIKAQNIEFCSAIVISKKYFPRLDLFLFNISSNVTLLYHNIKRDFPNFSDVDFCEFDKNQLDLMYSIDLDDDDSLDIKEVEEILKVKKTFNVTITTKTLEQNYLVQKYFDTNKNTITFDYFNKIVSKSSNFLDSVFDEKRDDSYYRTNTYPQFIIECDTIEDMNIVLSFFKINTKIVKTSRVNFKRVEKIFKK